jgi:hypothetical protein
VRTEDPIIATIETSAQCPTILFAALTSKEILYSYSLVIALGDIRNRSMNTECQRTKESSKQTRPQKSDQISLVFREAKRMPRWYIPSSNIPW